jgi:hypothetical protein
VAVLALEKDQRFGLSIVFLASILSISPVTAGAAVCGAAVIDGENHDRPGMADDIAAGANSAWFFDFIGSDVEDGSVICDARREDAGPR